MFTHINFQIETVLILVAPGLFFQLFQHLNHYMADTRAVSAEDYFYKITRITGASEYETFPKVGRGQARVGIHAGRPF